MLCASCNTAVPDGTTTCPHCQAALAPPKRRRRRRDGDEDVPPERIAAYDRPVQRMLPWVLVSVVPFLGLLLAPILAGLLGRLMLRGRGDPAFTARRATRQLLYVSLICAAAQWAGLALLLLAWRGE